MRVHSKDLSDFEVVLELGNHILYVESLVLVHDKLLGFLTVQVKVN